MKKILWIEIKPARTNSGSRSKSDNHKDRKQTAAKDPGTAKATAERGLHNHVHFHALAFNLRGSSVIRKAGIVYDSEHQEGCA